MRGGRKMLRCDPVVKSRKDCVKTHPSPTPFGFLKINGTENWSALKLLDVACVISLDFNV